MIGSNISAVLQVKDEGKMNKIGEREHQWGDVTSLKGWLDLSDGTSNHTNFSAKIEESSHVFICDFASLKNLSQQWVWNPFNFLNGIVRLPNKSPDWRFTPFSFITGNIENFEDAEVVDVTSDNARIVIDGKIYEITFIDDPMQLHQHLEIFLRFIGGQNG